MGFFITCMACPAEQLTRKRSGPSSARPQTPVCLRSSSASAPRLSGLACSAAARR